MDLINKDREALSVVYCEDQSDPSVITSDPNFFKKFESDVEYRKTCCNNQEQHGHYMKMLYNPNLPIDHA